MKTVLTLLLVVLVSFGIGYTQEHHGHNQHEEADAVSQANPISEDLGICPVMGGKANKESSYYYEGKTYYFCCPGCISKFKEDPEKYIAKKKEFNLEAYQYGFEPEEIVVNKDDVVTILVSSRDVTHGVYIKDYGINVSVKKGETKKIELIAKETGEFPILCSVYCGKGHHSMKAKLIVK